ncbi:MAG TPA: CocE/NonD family hydrolase [Streptosporangiaceae bacterium]|nr:CocE/NonD family hydrolase [Streptosporangiaceae bacterium]
MAKLDVPAVPVIADHNQPIEMRDGTRLRADVYRAAEGGPFPALLIRTPYGEQMLRAAAPVMPAIDAGFAVVLQHCRGTGTSDGEFVTFENEAADGADTIEWCARQPWCDGSVAMTGPSYLGMVQLAAAATAPQALRGMALTVTPADYHWGLAYRQGAFQLGQALGWHLLKTGQQLAYRAAAGQDISAAMPGLLALMASPAAAYERLPLRDMPAVSDVIPSWRTWLDHEQRDQYWAGLSYRDGRHRVSAPALHVGGWFDLFLGGTLDNFTTLSRHAATERARRGQRLIVGPWTHADRTGAAGELYFGAAASEQAIRLEQAQLDFLRRAVRPDQGPTGEGREGQADPSGPDRAAPRVKLFVMGDNVWRDEDDWPLARTRWTPWYLHGDGSLSPSAPQAGTAPSRYAHDPRDPVPTVGGATLLASGAGGVARLAGPRDQRAVESRPDLLSFTSAELAEDLEVTGPVTVTLHAATSAADTDFTARLVDVWPDGRALGITDGIVRARYRDGTGRATPIVPGQVHEYSIDLIATSQVFRAGHRLRVDVASSNFPCYDRNPGNGALAATATEDDFVVAEQAVYHDSDHQSRITLPVIPRPGRTPADAR